MFQHQPPPAAVSVQLLIGVGVDSDHGRASPDTFGEVTRTFYCDDLLVRLERGRFIVFDRSAGRRDLLPNLREINASGYRHQPSHFVQLGTSTAVDDLVRGRCVDDSAAILRIPLRGSDADCTRNKGFLEIGR
jgi:hypothetical protein